MRYKKVEDNEVVQPRRQNYKMMCCDCGLVHSMDFWIVSRGKGRGYKIQFRARRDNRATANARRKKGLRCRLITRSNKR